MPRLARLDAPGVLHHVMGRGIEKRKIFWNDKDRVDFIDRLAGVVEKGEGIYFKTDTSLLCARRDSYLKELVRYIHLNLLRSGIVKDIKELNRCRWSGHSALAGKVDRKWQDCEYVLSYFGKGRQAQTSYLRYVEKGIPQGRRPELVGKRTCGFQDGRLILSY